MITNYYHIAELVGKAAKIAATHQLIYNNLLAKELCISSDQSTYIISILKLIGILDDKLNFVSTKNDGSSDYVNLSKDAQTYCVAAATWKLSHPEDLNKGLWVCKNSNKADILETGINPSGTEGCFITRESEFADCNDRYWKRLKSIYCTEILDNVAYLDLFPFHEADQLLAEKTNPELLRDFLQITMERIENINPSLVIIGNKRSTAFWGHHPKFAWMDYDFGNRIDDALLPIQARGINLEVYQIQGFFNRTDRIHRLLTTNLSGSIIINYGYHGRIPHTMTPEITKAMLDFAKQQKEMFCRQRM